MQSENNETRVVVHFIFQCNTTSGI